MGDRLDETSHVIFIEKFKNNKKYKEQLLQEIMVAVCAMLNSNGGKVVINFATDRNDISFESSLFSQMSFAIRALEQYMISIIGVHKTVSKMDFREDKKSIIILIGKADSLLTINYNLYLPSETQVVEMSPLEPLETMKDIINRKAIPNPVGLGSHCQIFCKDKNCGLCERRICQLKHVKAEQYKRTSLADRITGKGNKFNRYVSAFANHCGGHIYYGVDDNSIVKGEVIPKEKDKGEITKKVEKAINKVIWPEQIGQPRRGKHWEIFFEPVLDETSRPVPSTFVIVIYIAPCLGGVFTDVPECYEMVEGKVVQMSFTTWKKRSSRPVWLCGKEKVPHSIPLVPWRSAAARKAFTHGSEKLRKLINNGDWDVLLRECQSPQKDKETKLLVLSKQVTACYRRGHFTNACSLLEEYMTILPEVQDVLYFEAVGLHIKAALKRATGDFRGLREALTAALSKAELIEPGLVTAAVYGFAATVGDMISSEDESSPDILAIKCLEHLRHVEDSPHFCADKTLKVHIILATFYLGCNIRGQLINQNIVASDLEKAKSSIMAVHSSTCDGNPLSKYREVQFKLVQSIYSYRHSQIIPSNRIGLLQNAFDNAKAAESMSREHQFTEMVEWSKTIEALFKEELRRAKSQV